MEVGVERFLGKINQ